MDYRYFDLKHLSQALTVPDQACLEWFTVRDAEKPSPLDPIPTVIIW